MKNNLHCFRNSIIRGASLLVSARRRRGNQPQPRLLRKLSHPSTLFAKLFIY